MMDMKTVSKWLFGSLGPSVFRRSRNSIEMGILSILMQQYFSLIHYIKRFMWFIEKEGSETRYHKHIQGSHIQKVRGPFFIDERYVEHNFAKYDPSFATSCRFRLIQTISLKILPNLASNISNHVIYANVLAIYKKKQL